MFNIGDTVVFDRLKDQCVSMPSFINFIRSIDQVAVNLEGKCPKIAGIECTVGVDR